MKSILIMLYSILLQASTVFGQFYLQDGASVNTTSNAIICLNNTSLINNGSLQQQAGSGKLVFTGDQDSYIDGSSISSIDQLDIAKDAGHNLLLNQDISIVGSLHFTSGFLNLNSKNIVLQSGAVVLNENDNSRITGSAGGSITGNDAAVNAPSLYNIGNLGASISTAANLGSVDITRTQIPVSTGAATGIERKFFIAAANNSSLNAVLRFYYLDAELNGNQESSLGLWKSNDGNNWSFAGADTRDDNANYVEKNGITDFSYWTLADALNALPITLGSFSVTCQQNDALLQWSTSFEQDIDRFIIQQSKDGIQWDDIGSEPARNNASGAVYNWKNTNAGGQDFYRLKIIAFSGVATYSPVFAGSCNQLSMPWLVYPNPSNAIATVRVAVRQNAHAVLTVMNTAGQVVDKHDWLLQTGVNTFVLSKMAALSPGTYIIQLFFNGTTLQQKIIRQ